MLSSVLRSPRAVQVNIAIMRAFVKLREILATHQELARRFDEMESKYDKQFRVVFDAIRQLMTPFEKPRRRIVSPRVARTSSPLVAQSLRRIKSHPCTMKQMQLQAGCGWVNGTGTHPPYPPPLWGLRLGDHDLCDNRFTDEARKGRVLMHSPIEQAPMRQPNGAFRPSCSPWRCTSAFLPLRSRWVGWLERA